MSESLVVRLGTSREQPVHWLVWSVEQGEIIASGILPSAQALGELKERAGGRPVVVLVPGSSLILRRVTLPGRYGRQSHKALPYLLEEQVASDVESLHIAVLGHDGNQVDLAALDREQMQSWLAWLGEADLTSRKLLPDVLALPLPAEGWAALQLGDEWLLRQGECQGMVAEAALLPLLLDGEHPPIHAHTALPAGVSGQWQAADPELPMLLLARGALTSRVNLLQGDFKPRSDLFKHWRPWRKVAIAAAVLLLMVLGNRGLDLYRLDASDKALKAEIRQVYTRIFPGETRIVNVRGQMEQHLRVLGQDNRGGLLLWMTELAPVFAQVQGLKPQVIRFDADRRELRLQVSAPGFAEVERFRELAGKGFAVQQGELRSEEGKVEGMLILRSKG